MKKEDILELQSSYEIMKTLVDHHDLWDDEINEHLKAVKGKENLERFGSEDVLYTPFTKQELQETTRFSGN